ncbi:expressed unknown protein [Seminavis robusta]|uniref:Uncharacterized protein n=1 Tax=Seminavis robusta TaxID=568900 RepID=A0A9N8HIA3_9STRA|nr:expressed unknown protein [Seminavis robusta]|eukprot:Sro687_g187220.1 n/a (345) ;mRNA; r:18109-19143
MGLLDSLKQGFNTAVAAVQDAEANLRGEKWLAEVKDTDGNWKKLEGWQEQYEPKKEPKKESTEAKPEKTETQLQRQDAATQLAINTVFSKIEDGLTMQIMNIMMEVSSKVIGTTHEVLSKDKTASEASLEILPVLAALNTMLLSYRFDKTGCGTSNKFRFIRKTASGELSNVVFDMYAQNKTPDDIAAEIKAAFGDDKSSIRAILLTKIDETMKTYSAQMAAGAEEAGDSTEALQKARSLMGEGQNNVFAQFLSFMLVSKLEVVEEHLKNFIDEFLASCNAEHEAKKSKEDVQAAMFAFVEKKYSERLQEIMGQVKTYTDMAKAAVLTTPMAVSAETADSAGEE